MIIYGVAILASCFLLGQFIGEFLGRAIQIDANVGGVGFAMILLILVNTWLHRKGLLDKETEGGVAFWSGMYVPIIIAMSAIQNVQVALSGGWVALLAGSLATFVCLMLVPVLSRFSKNRGEGIQ